jgi:cysteine desulfurase/selenocysteine lyase
VLGTENPVAEIIEKAHQAGAKVLIDGAQAVMHHAVDVQALDCDFVFRPQAVWADRDRRAVCQGRYPAGDAAVGRGRVDDRHRQPDGRTTYARAPWRFEAGTPNTGGIIGLGAAVAYVSSVGLDAIQEYEQLLMHYAAGACQRAGFDPLRPSRSTGVIAFNLGKHMPMMWAASSITTALRCAPGTTAPCR